MDWTTIIAHNRDALLGVAGTLLAMLAGVADRVPRSFQRSILRLLVPAESALRRLIVVAARDLVAEPVKPRRDAVRKSGAARAPAKNPRKPVFRLTDRRKSFAHLLKPKTAKNGPRIWSIDDRPLIINLPQFRPAPPPPKPKSDGLVAAGRLARRVEALIIALKDIPAQAMRLVRWRERQARANKPAPSSPLRSGRAPGHRHKPEYPVDEILADCHAFAIEALHPDTS